MSGRVLIIDDEPNSVMLLETFLKDTVAELQSLKDPAKFEETIADFAPDLILLDYHMPKIDGLEILRRIRSDEFSKYYLPVVVLTSDTTRVARHSALVLGADDFLTKPLDRNEVVLRVRNLLRTRELYVQLARANEAAERRAEQIARESERSFRLVFVSHPEPMWVYDLETLAFLEVNDAAIQHYGFSRDEFLAMTIRDIRPPDQVALLRQSVAIPDVLQRSGPWVHRTKDGSIIEVEVTSHILTFSGRKARFVMAQDVTERRRLERQLNQAQRLESLGQLAGGVAHDFNNLLAVILNFVQFSMAKVSAVADATNNAGLAGAIKDLERVEKAAKSAASLTRQLLTFARHEVVQPRVVEINSVIGELEPLLRRTLGEHIEFRTEMGADLLPILIDKGQLEQILMNLSVNARDAMKVGGRLTIDTQNVDVDEAYATGRLGLNTGRYVRLRVSDSGTGMDADTLQHAFEPFFTTKPKGEGTGLGLATVHGIVNQAGGYVSIYSEPGMGTRVSVMLPATDQSPLEDQPSRESTPVAGGGTVLVVEDADDVREVIERILTANGYKVMLAASGPDALELLRSTKRQVDVLLTDVVMPRMQGAEVAERVRELQPRVRVLYMSGYAQTEAVSGTALEPILEKPFTEPDLLAKIHQVLQGSGRGS